MPLGRRALDDLARRRPGPDRAVPRRDQAMAQAAGVYVYELRAAMPDAKAVILST